MASGDGMVVNAEDLEIWGGDDETSASYSPGKVAPHFNHFLFFHIIRCTCLYTYIRRFGL